MEEEMEVVVDIINSCSWVNMREFLPTVEITAQIS